MLFARLYFFGLATVVVIAMGGCPSPIKSTIDNSFVNYLTKQAGYTTFPMPSSLESGGSLVYVKSEGKNKMVEWVGDLLSCGVPESVVFGESQESRNKARNADFPEFKASSKNDFGLGVKLPIKGIGVDADAKVFRKTITTVESAGHEVIQRLAVANFLADPLKRRTMKDYCARTIETQKVAVLVDVAYVEKGKFEFYKDDGLTIKATPPEVINILKLDANVHGNVEADGSMRIDKRIYVAFKESFYVPASGTLAASNNQLEDATVDLKAASGGL